MPPSPLHPPPSIYPSTSKHTRTWRRSRQDGGGLSGLKDRLRAAIAALEQSREYCVQLGEAIQGADVGALESLLAEGSHRPAATLTDANVKALVTEAVELLKAHRLREGVMGAVGATLAACDEADPTTDVDLCEDTLERARIADMGDYAHKPSRRFKLF